MYVCVCVCVCVFVCVCECGGGERLRGTGQYKNAFSPLTNKAGRKAEHDIELMKHEFLFLSSGAVGIFLKTLTPPSPSPQKKKNVKCSTPYCGI